MSQMNLFEEFDFGDFGGSDLVIDEAPKKAKEEKKPAAKKAKEEKKPAAKKTTAEKVTLPVRVCGGNIDMVLGASDFAGKDSVELKEIKKLLEKQYPELSTSARQLVISSVNKGVVLVAEIEQKVEKPDTKIAFDGLLPVTVSYGNIQAEYHEGEFDEEVTVKTIIDAFVKNYKVFDKCSFYYDSKKNVLVPWFTKQVGLEQEFKMPLKLGLPGSEFTIEENDESGATITLKEAINKLAESETDYTKYADKDTKISYALSDEYIVPVVVKGRVSSKTVELISLPVSLAFTFKPDRMELTPDMFEGKDTVEMIDIVNFVSKIYKMFTKDNSEFFYVSEENLVVANKKSSTKGAYKAGDKVNGLFPVLENSEVGEHLDGKSIFYFIGNHDTLFRVDSNTLGNFVAPCHENGEVVQGSKLFHMLTVPKIPYSLWEATVSMFKKNTNREAAVQIWYNAEKNDYKLVVPEIVSVSKAHISFKQDTKLYKEGYFLVCDIHSHNTMNAFFSATDNADEQGNQVYAVIGNLDRSTYSYKIRIGCEGSFADVTLDDVFEQ